MECPGFLRGAGHVGPLCLTCTQIPGSSGRGKQGFGSCGAARPVGTAGHPCCAGSGDLSEISFPQTPARGYPVSHL